MFSGLLWGGGAMLGSGGSGIRVAGGGFAGRQQASGVAERKFHGGDDVGERCTENGVAPKRRQLVGWPVPAENTQRAAMPGAGRQWAVHWQRRPSAGRALDRQRGAWCVCGRRRQPCAATALLQVRRPAILLLLLLI